MHTSRGVETTTLDVAVAQLRALADPTRLHILAVLARGPQCACSVQSAVDVSANLLSYHLRVLREAGLIEGTRRGRWIDYRLTSGAALVPSALRLAGIGPTPVLARSASCPPRQEALAR